MVNLGVAGLYTVAFVVWRGLLLTPLYDYSWQLRLSQVFTPWLYLLGLGPLLLALFTRQRAATLLLLLPLAGFGVEYGRQLLPNWPNVGILAQTELTVRILTWNTHYTTDDTAKFSQVLTAWQPDLVTLQEVSLFLHKKLARELSDRYPYQVVDTLSSSEALVILSRYPVVDRAFDSGYLRGCRCQQVTLDLRGQRVSLINTHVPSPRISINLYRRVPRIYRFDTQFQHNTVDALLTRSGLSDQPLILAGDLNLMDQQEPYQRLTQQLDDAFAAAGWGLGFTFPAGRRFQGLAIPPFVRIDHILFSEHWQALQAQSGPQLDSDHLFVVADLWLKNEPTPAVSLRPGRRIYNHQPL